MNLSARSYKKELLDNDDIPFAAIKQNMEELEVINKRLGGHCITLAGFKQLVGDKKEIMVCEIGCGGGDNLIAIKNWCVQKGIQFHLTGIDIKQECIDFAGSREELQDARLVVSDYRLAAFDNKPDIIFSALFCHHFTDEELIDQFTWMKENSKAGFFINDLHRHIVAYHAIRLLTRFFSNSYLVKNDAPLSVARGFTKNEMKRLLASAGIKKATVEWKWAFRYLTVYKHDR